MDAFLRVADRWDLPFVAVFAFAVIVEGFADVVDADSGFVVAGFTVAVVVAGFMVVVDAVVAGFAAVVDLCMDDFLRGVAFFFVLSVFDLLAEGVPPWLAAGVAAVGFACWAGSPAASSSVAARTPSAFRFILNS